MVVVKIGDGTGNQLFNYACGYATARRDHDSLMLDTSECDNSTLRKFELDNFQVRYDARESFSNQGFWKKIYKKIRRNIKYRVIMEREVYLNRKKQYDVNDIDPRVYEPKKIRNKYLQGYWQHVEYFEEYFDEIMEMIRPAYEQSEAVRQLTEQFQKTATCAVHVRGGDLTGPEGDYFRRAVMRMMEEKPDVKYVVFTNDRDRAEKVLEEIQKKNHIELSFISEYGTFSDIDEFFLMSACQNQILSNSTYSTWAAYANQYKEKTVIMPDDILSERMKLKDWIIL